jgi:hypothetical protein
MLPWMKLPIWPKPDPVPKEGILEMLHHLEITHFAPLFIFNLFAATYPALALTFSPDFCSIENHLNSPLGRFPGSVNTWRNILICRDETATKPFCHFGFD